jgi:hypothetical protein
MGRAGSHHHRRYTFRIVLVTIALIFICVRLALPFAIHRYVQRQLDRVPDYGGRVGSIQLNLWRGAYEIHDLYIVKTNANVPIPFVSIKKMDLSIEWPSLIEGKLVGEVELTRPSINFVIGPTEEEEQLGGKRGWKQTLESLFPLTINRFAIKDGAIRYADPSREPPVDAFVTNLTAVATNLTNVESKGTELPSGLVARGETTGGGEIRFELKMNPLAEQPTFQLAASLTGVDLRALNDFILSFGGIEAKQGMFWLYLRVAAADGAFQGYAKPFLLDVSFLEWSDITQQNVLKSFWEGFVQFLSNIFRNHPHDQIATVIPIEGNFETGNSIDLWTTISGVLRNAFLEALQPGVPAPVPLPEEGQTSAKADAPQSARQ